MEIQKIKLQMIKEGKPIYTLDTITSTKDIVELINAHEKYDLTPVQKVIVIGMNNKNQIAIYTEVAMGTQKYANIEIAEIIKPLLISNSCKFILVHNRPSGDSTPSKEDINITKQIQEISKIMGLEFLDHIIIADDNYTSIIKELKGGE